MTGQDNPLTKEQLNVLLHDLQGPVTNAKAFCSELNDVIQVLIDEADNTDIKSSAQNHDKLRMVLTEDIAECATHIATSLEVLQNRISQFCLKHK